MGTDGERVSKELMLSARLDDDDVCIDSGIFLFLFSLSFNFFLLIPKISLSFLITFNLNLYSDGVPLV